MKFVCLFFPIIFCINSHAQNTQLPIQSENLFSLNTAGGTLLGKGQSVTYSLGQLFYDFSSNLQVELSKGVQQGAEKSERKEELPVNFKAFPNPTTSILFLEFEKELVTKYTFQLLTLDGKSVATGSIKKLITKLQLDFLPKGIFILMVKEENRILKSIKIIKN